MQGWVSRWCDFTRLKSRVVHRSFKHCISLFEYYNHHRFECQLKEKDAQQPLLNGNHTSMVHNCLQVMLSLIYHWNSSPKESVLLEIDNSESNGDVLQMILSILKDSLLLNPLFCRINWRCPRFHLPSQTRKEEMILLLNVPTFFTLFIMLFLI